MMNESTYQERTASVLVVDDDPIVRILAREALEKTGFTVMETDNGREALSVFKRQQPDIVLLDVLMPQIDGFEVCVSLRELAGGRHVPVVIMTALEDIESVNHAYQAGATDFITKPINWTLLEHRVRYILRASQTERALRDARHQLEKRVEERTAELSQANARLTLEIEDRKRAEQELKSVYHDLQISQMQLVQSAKLASIGELASGIAHELNQPLMVIRTAAQLALRRCHEGDEHYDKLKLVENGTTRMSRIIDHLRTFSRQSKANVQPVDINQVIRDALLMTGEQLRLRAIEVV
ncbi:MAG: response regulator, partial [Desulforhabdus sp.]|nr:response regulator [Desulforhabdus sp.]